MTEPLLAIGTMVDHFKVTRFLGKGATSQVYLARDTMLGRRVALKLVCSRTCNNTAFLRFKREAQTTARLSHPNVISIYSIGEYHGMPYLALEYLEGQTLRQRLNEGMPGIREAMRIGGAIARALAEAHRRGILHRDLKPENVLIPKDGRPRVLDFGLAKLVDQENEVSGVWQEIGEGDDDVQVCATSPGQVHGTPAYLAPEYWLGGEATAAGDVWALGMILYELVVGSRPYQARTARELRPLVIAHAPVPKPPISGGETPEDLIDLVLACLSKDPKLRPTAPEVAARVELLLMRARRQLTAEANPFRGLLPFSERHADTFFGRDAEISAFVESMREQVFLPVVGPSGVGKSSFVRAGVVPRLREQGSWIVLRFRPGNDPFAAMALGISRSETTEKTGRITALMGRSALDILAETGNEAEQPKSEDRLEDHLRRSPALLNLKLHTLAEAEKCRVLLLVDQLEELYTLRGSNEEDRRQFMKAICAAVDDPESPVRVVVTVRDDFLGRIAESAEVGNALSRVTVVRRPDAEALREILLKQVATVGYSFDDPTLVDEMVAAVKDDLACLPLLQFASHLLWERRDRSRKTLTRAIYREIGGVSGALAMHADGLIGSMPPAQVMIARQLMLRLVTPEATRRVMQVRRVLEGMGSEGETVLGRLVDGRLLVVRQGSGPDSGSAVVELVHESLVRTWARLERWIEESKEDLRVLAEVGQAAELWDKRGRRDEEVWTGDALQEARRMLDRSSATPPEMVDWFLAAGERKERRARIRRWWSASASVVAAMLLLAVIAAVSMVKERETRRQKRLAEEQRVEAQAQRLLAQINSAEAEAQGARAAMLRDDLLEARAQLRSSLETQDSALARALWWQMQHNPLVRRYELPAELGSIAVSPDGQRLAVGCSDKRAYLLNLEGTTVRPLRGHEEATWAVAISPDGKRVATGSLNGRIRLWDLRTDTFQDWSAHDGIVYSLGFDPGGRYLASAGGDAIVRIHSVDGDGWETALSGHQAPIHRIEWSPDGRWLGSASFDATVRIWDWANAKEVKRISDAHGLAFHPAGKLLAYSTSDSLIHLADTTSGKDAAVFRGSRGRIRDIAIHPTGKLIVASSNDKRIRVWDIETGARVAVFEGHTHQIPGLAFAAGGRLIVSSSWDKTVRVWDPAIPTMPGSPGHRATIFDLAFSSDGKLLASASYDRTSRLWNVATGAEEQVFAGHGHIVTAAQFLTGRAIVTGSHDRTLRLWRIGDLGPGEIIGNTLANTIAISPDRKLLATSSETREIKLWELGASTARAEPGSPDYLVLRTVLPGLPHDAVASISFSPDGSLLATAGRDRALVIWDLKASKQRRLLRGTAGDNTSVAFSPDGKTLVSGGKDQIVRIWRASDGTSRVLGTHRGIVNRVAFHPDGRRVGSASTDGTAAIWELDSHRSLVLRSGRAVALAALAFSPDGRQLATGSEDGLVHLWETDSGRPLWRTVALLASPEEVLT
ncbi:MAG: protein kinase, partial [Pseudomonadota bacterium]